jgi:putative ABC transport system substrate-binding protein
LRDLLPAAARVAVLVNPTNVTNAPSTLRDVEAAVRTLELKIDVFNASTIREIDAAFVALVRERPDALFVAPDALFTERRVQLANLAARHALPASFSARENVEAGGLMSYGPSLADMYRQVGVYSGRILKGTRPADLPVVQSTRFDLVINVGTARMLGLTIPPGVLAIADEVIE